ncbi:PAF acetylhydrolase family protein [Phaeosphaeriaceae sp. SRC1lsM3a]|nr:PAF acetylhydrolase family protein [Stagonospora sp. SRC1lsM3a]
MQIKFSFLTFSLANMSAGYLLPLPPGRYNVTLTTGALTDYDRDARTLMLSIFQPTTCANTVPAIYMPNKTAEHEGTWVQKVFNISVDLTPLFVQARLPVCPNYNSCSILDNAPVLLLSPGYRGTRVYYNFIASAIASEGFTVITMDHPGETNVITYPDGHAAYSDLPNPVVLDELTPLAYIRAADASFIIDQLSNVTAMAEILPRNLHFPTDRVVMAGQSLGGAAAILAASKDPRIVGVINWDGPFFGSLPPSGLSQPVLYVATERPEDPRFSAVWPELKGPKLWIKVKDITHEGMLDFSTLLQAAGQEAGNFADALGTIPPSEMVGILTAYATEWASGAFLGKMGGSLLQNEEPLRFQEVSFVRTGNF